MVEINADGIKIRIDFSFFAVVTLFLCFDTTGYGIMSVAACFIHECGHLLMMSLRKKTPSAIEFYGGGVKIAGTVHDLPVIVAGSAANFLVAAAVFFTADGRSIYPLVFAAINAVTGLFNLLPLGYLDGKNLAEHIFIRKLAPHRAVHAMHIVEGLSCAFVVSAVASLIVFRLINFTAAIMVTYLVLLDIFLGRQ